MREPRFWMKVWDAPTRLFHWAVVVLVAVSYVTMRYNRMEWHFLSGYALLTLLLFRLAWGFVGSDTSRFRQFLRSPLAGLRHLGGIARREPDTEIGHNAAGGWMVLLMLAALASQAVLGLFSGDVDVQGPLTHLVSPAWSDRLSGWHGVDFYDVILPLIGLHVVAIIVYAVVKRHDLVRPMITGRKRLPGRLRAPRMRSPALAGAILALAAMMVWVTVTRF